MVDANTAAANCMPPTTLTIALNARNAERYFIERLTNNDNINKQMQKTISAIRCFIELTENRHGQFRVQPLWFPKTIYVHALTTF